MGLDELPQQFDALVEAARAALHGEITSAKAIVARANAEKASAANALADLQAQCKSAQDQLTAVTKESQRSTALHGVGYELEKARAELAQLKAETAKAEKALAALSKERNECQAKVIALNNEVSQLGAVRAHNQELIAKIRSQFLGA
jgi:chromosome segregation ATPase